MSPETRRPQGDLMNKDWGAEVDKAQAAKNQEDLKNKDWGAEVDKAQGKPSSEVEESLAELQEIEKQRIKDEAEGKWKPAEKPKSELEESLAELQEIEKQRVEEEKRHDEYEKKLLAEGWVKGEVRGKGVLYPDASFQKFEDDMRTALAERLTAAPDKRAAIDKKIEQMKDEGGVNLETFARYQAEAGDYGAAMASLQKSEVPYAQSKGFARVAEFQMQDGADPSEALKQARAAAEKIPADDKITRELAMDRVEEMEKANQKRLEREARKAEKAPAKTEAAPQAAEEVWEEVDVSDIIEETPEAPRELPESAEMMTLRSQADGLRRQLETLNQTASMNVPGGERGKQLEAEFLNDKLEQIQDKMLAQVEKESVRQARIEAMGKRVDAAMAREDRGIALADVDRSFEDKIDAAEAEAAKADEAFADQVQGVLEELKDVPLGPNMKKVLEGSPEAKQAAAARQKVEALKQDREAARGKVREQFPMPEEEPAIEVTDDMIEEIRDLTPEEMAEAKAVAEKNVLSPERRKVVEEDIKKTEDEIWNLENGIEIIDRETGKTETKLGLKELEKKLKDFGLDADEMMEKKALSRWESFKLGLKSMVKPELRRTIREYQKRLDEHGDASDRLALSKLELKNPKAYAQVTQQRLFRTLLAGVRRQANSKPATAGFMNLKF